MPMGDLDALKTAYQRQYRLCCHLKTETAYTQLTILRYRAVHLANQHGLVLEDNDFPDHTKTSILALIARCERLHAALVAERCLYEP